MSGCVAKLVRINASVLSIKIMSGEAKTAKRISRCRLPATPWFHQKCSVRQKMHQIYFRPGLRPWPRRGSLLRSPMLSSRLGSGIATHSTPWLSDPPPQYWRRVDALMMMMMMMTAMRCCWHSDVIATPADAKLYRVNQVVPRPPFWTDSQFSWFVGWLSKV